MGWQELASISADFRQLALDDATTPPVACRRDGEPLEAKADDGLFCPACGWRPDDLMGELRS